MRSIRAIAMLGALISAGAQAEGKTVEVFADHGEVFIRAGGTAGLTVGTSLRLLGDRIGDTPERRHVGTATVMEVWPQLARVTLDPAAKADRSAAKLAVLEKNDGPTEPAPLSPPPAPPTATSVVAPRPAPLSATLNGSATFRGLGHFRVLVLNNEDPKPWTHCTLTLPGSFVYSLEHLDAGDHESISFGRFEQKGKGRDVPIDFVSITCTEGTGTFVFPN